MPEGSEVRVIADELLAACNLVFKAAEIVENEPDKEHRFSRKPIQNWDQLQQPWRILDVRTKGKLIILDIKIINNGEKLVGLSTLGMSGDWRFNSGSHKHCRFSFLHEQGDLSFVDVRCFGSFRLLSPIEAQKHIDKIGWDLLQAPMPENDWKALQSHKKITNKPLGAALMDQSLFSGLGNIYKCEAIYELGLNPTVVVKDLSENLWAKINSVSHEILQKAYLLKGSSVADFTANGKEGQAQTLHKIYGKDNCPAGHPVTKTTQKCGSTERTTWWCKGCHLAKIKFVAIRPDHSISTIGETTTGIHPPYTREYSRKIFASGEAPNEPRDRNEA